MRFFVRNFCRTIKYARASDENRGCKLAVILARLGLDQLSPKSDGSVRNLVPLGDDFFGEIATNRSKYRT